MFLRRYRRNKDGKQHTYFALVESVRTEAGPRQHIVAYLGELTSYVNLGAERFVLLVCMDYHFDPPTLFLELTQYMLDLTHTGHTIHRSQILPSFIWFYPLRIWAVGDSLLMTLSTWNAWRRGTSRKIAKRLVGVTVSAVIP